MGKSGYLCLGLTEIIYPKRREKRLIFAGYCDDNTMLTQDEMRRMFDLSGEQRSSYSFTISEDIITRLKDLMQAEQKAIIEEMTVQDNTWFDEELMKLEKWAQDVKQSMEKSIKNMDSEIAELKKQSRKTAVLKDKLAIEKKINTIETRRNQQRFDLYSEQDKIDQKKEKLIGETIEKLQQNITSNNIFYLRWNIA